jgi:hypothetical protein
MPPVWRTRALMTGPMTLPEFAWARSTMPPLTFRVAVVPMLKFPRAKRPPLDRLLPVLVKFSAPPSTVMVPPPR